MIHICMSKIQLSSTYHDIISLENLLEAWQEFVKGKRHRRDVQEFELNLMSNIIGLHIELAAKTYRHSPYQAFNISDPKPRNIHKAVVRDRLLHHALYRLLYPFFDRTFIADSYSCRKRKGTHKALHQFRYYAYKVSQNHMKTVWVLKCDIKKFFASVDHSILFNTLNQYIPDNDIRWLLSEIVESFYSTKEGKGLPLGNLTSQLLVNIYMNEFDRFVKHTLKARYYIRYADDFVILSQDKKWLERVLFKVQGFLKERLRLELHPDKVSIRTITSGIDFLGWVHFPDHRVIRTKTKRRIFRGIHESGCKQDVAQSYLGLLKHGNARQIQSVIMVDKIGNQNEPSRGSQVLSL